MSNTWGALSWNQGNWAGQGDITAQPTGIAALLSVGQVTSTGIVEIGWGGDAWNINAWGQLQPFENVTGQSLTTSVGSTTVTADANVSITGQSLTSSVGTQIAGISFDITVTGQALTTSIGTEIVDIGVPVTGIMMDNLKGNTRLIDTKGSEVGLFDEMGSVYSYDIVAAEVDGEWVNVEHTEKQLKLKATVSQMWG